SRQLRCDAGPGRGRCLHPRLASPLQLVANQPSAAPEPCPPRSPPATRRPAPRRTSSAARSSWPLPRPMPAARAPARRPSRARSGGRTAPWSWRWCQLYTLRSSIRGGRHRRSEPFTIGIRRLTIRHHRLTLRTHIVMRDAAVATLDETETGRERSPYIINSALRTLQVLHAFA